MIRAPAPSFQSPLTGCSPTCHPSICQNERHWVHIILHLVLVRRALQINDHVPVKEGLVAHEEVLSKVSSWALHVGKLHLWLIVGDFAWQLDVKVRLH